MFDFAHPAQRAGDESSPPSGYASKPLRYDPELVADLSARYDALQRQVAALAHAFERDPQTAAAHAQSCAERLHELRQWEAIRLYPVISRGLCGDAVAERQWVILRFVVNGLAHRLVRAMEALGDVRDAAAAQPAIAAAVEALGAYRTRNETDLYPLYAVVNPCGARLRA